MRDELDGSASGARDEIQPSRSSQSTGALERYGVVHRHEPGDPLYSHVPMVDGYWTPWHIAQAAIDTAHWLRTENGRRLHDQHCAWCDCEEFVAVRYGSLHHLSERAARAVKAVVAVVENPHCPECGSPEKRGGCVTCADGW